MAEAQGHYVTGSVQIHDTPDTDDEYTNRMKTMITDDSYVWFIFLFCFIFIFFFFFHIKKNIENTQKKKN